MEKLTKLREKIDVLDEYLIQILHRRLQVVKEVGKIKKEMGLQPLDKSRWSEVLSKRLSYASSLGLRKEFVEKILDIIHEEALQIEKQI